MNTIGFTKAKFIKLCKAHKKASLGEKETFMFEGVELLTSYAKYLIEFLTNAFK